MQEAFGMQVVHIVSGSPEEAQIFDALDRRTDYACDKSVFRAPDFASASTSLRYAARAA